MCGMCGIIKRAVDSSEYCYNFHYIHPVKNNNTSQYFHTRLIIMRKWTQERWLISCCNKVFSHDTLHLQLCSCQCTPVYVSTVLGHPISKWPALTLNEQNTRIFKGWFLNKWSISETVLVRCILFMTQVISSYTI